MVASRTLVSTTPREHCAGASACVRERRPEGKSAIEEVWRWFETVFPIVAWPTPEDGRLCHALCRGARRCQAVPDLDSKDTPYLSLAHSVAPFSVWTAAPHGALALWNGPLTVAYAEARPSHTPNPKI
eukprot:359423-Chlamydomonas_euryale.AAC.2